MKKILLTTAILLTCLFSYSQDFSYGAKGGLNFANLDCGACGADGVVKIHLGVFAQFEVSDQIIFQPELLISGHGAEFGGFKVNFTYLAIPLIGKYMITENIDLQAGFELGLLLGGEDDAGDKVSKDSKGLNLAFSIGGGYTMDTWIFSARYNLGLSDIDDTGSNQETKHRVFQISVAKILDLGL